MGVPGALGLAAVGPVVVFLIWFRNSRGFREYLLSLDPAMVTAAHAWRIEGIVFITLWAVGRLPGAFALPAGIGDMAIGFTAPVVARAFRKGRISSRAFVAWQVAGIADLVVAVTTAVLSSDSRLQGSHGAWGYDADHGVAADESLGAYVCGSADGDPAFDLSCSGAG